MTDPQPTPLAPARLTISQAVATYQVSESTLRRQLKQGKVLGAQLMTGPYGDSWAVPDSWLAARYRRRPATDQGSDSPPAPVPPELAQLVELLMEQSRELAQLRATQLEAAKVALELTAATTKADALAGEAEALRSENAQQAAELAQLRAVVATSRRLRRRAAKAARGDGATTPTDHP